MDVNDIIINIHHSLIASLLDTDRYDYTSTKLVTTNSRGAQRVSPNSTSLNRFINTQYSTALQLKWMMWYNEDLPELCAFPNNALLSLNPFQRLLFIEATRPDRFIQAVSIAVAAQPLVSLDTAIFFRSMPTFKQMQTMGNILFFFSII
jgi:hypothetical protein